MEKVAAEKEGKNRNMGQSCIFIYALLPAECGSQCIGNLIPHLSNFYAALKGLDKPESLCLLLLLEGLPFIKIKRTRLKCKR